MSRSPAKYLPQYLVALMTILLSSSVASSQTTTTGIVTGPIASINDATAEEGDDLIFTVTLSTATTTPVVVTYGISDGTTTVGSDYAGSGGMVTIDPGFLTGSINVATIEENLFEANETLIVDLLSTSVGGTSGQGVGTILNDDCAPDQTQLLDASCSAALDDYSALASISGPGLALTQTPPPGTIVTGFSSLAVTLEITGAGVDASTCVFTVNFLDETPPMLTAPADVTIECDASTSPMNTGMATATDACSAPIVGSSDLVFPGGCPGDSLIERTWTASDDAGNFADSIQFITVTDSTPPTIIAPADITIECDADFSPANTGMPTVTDNCDAEPLVSFTDVETDFCPLTIVRTWTAVDSCGNQAEATQMIERGDSVAPMLVVPADVTVSCGADLNPGALGVATATDACDAALTIEFVDAPFTLNCGVLIRTWTATDACGNSASGDQMITVEDSTPPVLTVPGPLTLVSCNVDSSPATTGQATATDNCDKAPVVTFVDAMVSGPCAAVPAIQRTWTATDACGNSVSDVQMLTIVDTTPPVLIVPPAATLDCQALEGLNVGVGTATATDDCDPNPLITFDDEPTAGGCTSQMAIERTWTATDACGNSVSGVQIVTFVDTTPPTLVVPADVTVECGQSLAPIDTGEATGFDNCGAVTVSAIDVILTVGCTGMDSIERQWTAVDSCGNVASGTQLITVLDTTPPVVVAPPDATITCAEFSPGNPSITDACSAVTNYTQLSTFLVSVVPGAYTRERHFTATDECGNTTLGDTQTVTVLAIACPPDVTVMAAPGEDSAAVNLLATAYCAGWTLSNDSTTGSGMDDASGLYPRGDTVVTFTGTHPTLPTVTCQTTVTVLTQDERVTDCLLALYDFSEGAGNTVNDVSGETPAIPLTIADPTNVTWLPDGGLSVDSAATISSLVPATRIVTACVSSGEVTIEAWVRPLDQLQSGPGRIVSLSENGFPVGGNAMLGQQGADYRTRARTTATGQFGKPELNGSNEVVPGALQHVVFTRDTVGVETLFVDNVQVTQSSAKSGDFSNWGDYRLALANEPGLTPAGVGRPWVGDLHLVALYKKALSAEEVTQNYNAGVNLPPTIITQPQDQLVLAGETATFSVVATGSMPLAYQWQERTGAFVNGATAWMDLTEETDAVLVLPNVSPFPSGRQYRCVVSNGEGSVASDPASLFVQLPPPPSVQFEIIPAQQTVEVGDDVTFVYSVLNDGGVGLILQGFFGLAASASCSNATFVGGDSNDNDVLDPGETWAFTCTIPDVQLPSFCIDMRVELGLAPGLPMTVNGGDLIEFASACVDVIDPPAVPERVTDCQLVLYRFLEGAGSDVFDVSGESPPIDMTITNLGDVSWLSEGGLSLNSPTVISSLVPATRVIDACQLSNALTIEAWVRPLDMLQSGPGRIVALSENGFPVGGNAMLGQQGADYRTRARTTVTGQFGKPELNGANEVQPGALQHVVFTRDTAGVETLFVDNMLVTQSSAKGGNFSNWGAYRLAFGNTPGVTPSGAGRPWLGELHLVAMYKKALSNAEVAQNHAAGLGLPPVAPTGPSILAGPDDTTVIEGEDASFLVAAAGAGTLTYQWEEFTAGWAPLAGEVAATLLITGTTLADDDRVFRCLVTDSSGSTTSASATLTVNPIPVAALELTLNPQDAIVASGDDLFVQVTVTNTGDLPVRINSGVFTFELVAPGVPEFCGFQQLTVGSTLELQPGASRTQEACFQDVNSFVTYTVRVTGTAGPLVTLEEEATGTITVQAGGRVTEGQVALYEFLEPSGATVEDTSGFGAPLDLQIESLPAVARLAGGGVAINQATRIVSPGPATKIVTSCQATDEITLEVWLQAVNDTQTGPARIVSLAGNAFPVGGNFILGQSLDQFASRLRSTSTNQFGKPELLTPTPLFSTASLHHLVLTRDAAGNQTLYLDGAVVDQQTIAGTFANWGAYRLCLGNEAEPTASGAGRPWLGDLHLVAIFNRALTGAEVQQNYSAGLGVAPVPND